MTKNEKLIGHKINGLEIVSYNKLGRRQYFECLCICGNKFEARTDAIKSGSTKSCGCLTGDLISKKNRLPDNSGAINLVYRIYKHNAVKRSLDFSLSIEDFNKLIFDKCIYCGIEPQSKIFVSSQLNRRDKELSYNGIDRVDNNIGYIMSNCVSCCSICNAAKSDLSIDQFRSWISRLIEFNRKR